MSRTTAPRPVTPPTLWLPRGVHLLPFLTAKGHKQIVAVDSRSREVARAILTKGRDPFKANERMWAALDRSDPR